MGWLWSGGGVDKFRKPITIDSMPISIYQKKFIDERKAKAIRLYKQGMTTREIGKLLSRSRQWVSNAVNSQNKSKVAKQ